MNYSDDPRFKDYYFEDSYVLSVNVGSDRAVFELLAVAGKEHPDFRRPGPNEHHQYIRAELWFKNAALDYRPSGVKPSWDAQDRWDYGNIDSFRIEDPDTFMLEGDWGSLKAVARNAFVKEL